MNDEYYNRVGHKRITSRQIDELVGIARGLIADNKIHEAEVEFLQKWLAANSAICEQPLIRVLYQRVDEILADGIADENEKQELLDTLSRFSTRDFELGEVLKPATLPLDDPPPPISFEGSRFCFTGTFNYGRRKVCEQAVVERGGTVGGVSKRTNFLVIGSYATDSWKHSPFGNKIIKGCELRDGGTPLAIISELHWVEHL
ncbi:MAG TPA: BRCT domain-containing protein [Kofleriaceae bacterium]|nr:BRCT domain-containing protein [Kofleriaceae bacterium]